MKKDSQTTSPRFQCLSAADIFCDLSTEEIGALSRRAPVRQVAAKTLIYAPEQALEMMFFLNHGRVQLYQLSSEGKILTNALLESGTLFGEMVLLGQTMSGHYAETLTDCVVCMMTVADVQTLLLSDARISNRLVHSLGKRLLDAQRQLSMITLKPVLNRVAWALLYLTEREGNNALHITHEAIGNLTGCSRETVTKILNQFASDQWVRLGRGQITVIDIAAITTLADT